MLNKELVLKALLERENGATPNFSEIELNQAVDLVIFNNYTIEQVCNMSSEELDMVSNPEDYDEYITEDYYICPCCGKKIIVRYDGERIEGYWGFCECGHDYSIYLDDCNNITHEQIQTLINQIYADRKAKEISLKSLLDDNKISLRSYNALISKGYKSLDDVKRNTVNINDLLRIRNLGINDIKNIIGLLKTYLNVCY